MRALKSLVIMGCFLVLPVVSSGQGLLELSYFNSVQVRPFAKIGYAKIVLNLDVPVEEASVNASRLAFNPFNIKLEDTGMLVGCAGFEVRSGPNWGLLVEGSANAQESSAVRVGEIGNLYGNRARLWNGSQFDWWSVDGAVFYNVYGTNGLVLGGKVGHTMLKLADPRLANGTPVSDLRIISFSGDIRSKL